VPTIRSERSRDDPITNDIFISIRAEPNAAPMLMLASLRASNLNNSKINFINNESESLPVPPDITLLSKSRIHQQNQQHP
jgi:hypothetical protein